jgi:hypothetical protein
MPIGTTHEGYLLIDHKSSPGTTQVPEGRIFESATTTCNHCQKVIVLNPNRTRPRHYCPGCDKYICDECEFKRTVQGIPCMPFDKLADEILNAAAKGQQYKGLII